MADLKHCAQMADSKCHHPIEFLFPEYANDRYTIQRDARSIGFFFLGIHYLSAKVTPTTRQIDSVIGAEENPNICCAQTFLCLFKYYN